MFRGDRLPYSRLQPHEPKLSPFEWSEDGGRSRDAFSLKDSWLQYRGIAPQVYLTEKHFCAIVGDLQGGELWISISGTFYT